MKAPVNPVALNAVRRLNAAVIELGTGVEKGQGHSVCLEANSTCLDLPSDKRELEGWRERSPSLRMSAAHSAWKGWDGEFQARADRDAPCTSSDHHSALLTTVVVLGVNKNRSLPGT